MIQRVLYLRSGIVILLGLLVSFQCSCKKQQNQIKKDNTSKIVISEKVKTERKVNFLNKKVSLPDSIIPLGNQNLLENGLASKKMVVFFDANCSMCFMQMMKWRKFMDEHQYPNDKLSIAYVVTASNKTMLEINLNQIKFPLDLVYWDINDEMIENLPFLIDGKNYNYCSFLLNENNNISFIGNPVNNIEDFNRLSVILKENDN